LADDRIELKKHSLELVRRRRLMKSRLPLALALTGLIGVGVVSAAQLADAQQASPPTQTAPAEHAREGFRPSASDRAAFAEARLAALHAGLALTPDQEKLWPPVEAALREAHKTIAVQRKQMHEGERPSDPVAWLKRISENQLARGEALKKLADAAAPLYATLSDEQKHRVPVLLHALRPHHHHHHHFASGEGERGHHGWWHRGEEHRNHWGNREHEHGRDDNDGDE
jgi:zinc resistance-associated protein